MLKRTFKATTDRRRSAIPAVAAAIMLLAACGGDNAAESDLTESVPDDEATLTVWSFLPGNYEGGEKAYDEVIAAFEEEHPQIDIELRNMPYPTYFDSVRNATVARKGPDVITMY